MSDTMRFLSYEDLDEIQMEFGTPSFVYDEAILRANARAVIGEWQVHSLSTINFLC